MGSSGTGSTNSIPLSTRRQIKPKPLKIPSTDSAGKPTDPPIVKQQSSVASSISQITPESAVAQKPWGKVMADFKYKVGIMSPGEHGPICIMDCDESGDGDYHSDEEHDVSNSR